MSKYYHINCENHHYFNHLKKLVNIKNIRCIIRKYLHDVMNIVLTNLVTTLVLYLALPLIAMSPLSLILILVT